MFNEDWVLVILVLLILGAVLGQSAFILIPILLIVVTLIGWGWNRFVLHRTTYERAFSEERLFAGETLNMSVSVSNAKPLPVPWLQVEDLFPAELEITGRKLPSSSVQKRHVLSHVASLALYERVRWDYEIECNERGFYFFGPAEVTAGDIFGVFRRDREIDSVDRVIVYPRVVDLPELGFPGKEPFGEQTAKQRIFEDPSRTIGVREYHPEDSLRRVHWKATARHSELQVKVYEPTITQQLAVFLNVATFAQPWLGVDRQRQEHVISIAASTAYHATNRKFAVGLIANGSVPNSDQPIKVLPGRAPDQLTHILEALAAVTSFATSKIESVIKATNPELVWGATLVVITSIVTDDLLAEMTRLQDAGRRMVLVSTDQDFKGDGPPGMVVHHLPSAKLDYAGRWEEKPAEAPEADAPSFEGRWDGNGAGPQ